MGVYTLGVLLLLVVGAASSCLALDGPADGGKVVPVAPGEHPRLFFRQDKLAEFRERAKTPEGLVITANLRELLKQDVPLAQSQSGETRLAGIWAAGRATLYAITGDVADADATRTLVAKLVEMPVINMPELRRGSRYMGIAIAYDLCYNAWSEEFRTKVATYLAARADGLLTRKEGVQGDNPATQSNHNVEGRTQMGVIALAILGDPGTTPAVEQCITAARKDLTGWATIALGDHGWGTEGEGFTINCLNWGVYQFADAYQTVYGKPATDAAGFAWVLPLIMARVVGDDMPYFGPLVTHWDGSAGVFGSSFYLSGLITVPPAMRPAVKAFYDAHFGLGSKAPFKMANPAEALYMLACYPFDLTAKPLGDVLPRTIEDKRKGHYVFRNGFKDASDCLTVVHLHSDPQRKSWTASPGVQVRGLGHHWVDFDPTHTPVADFATVAGAQMTHYAVQDDGSGTLAGKMTKGTFALAVDYSTTSGAPALLALIDQSGVPLHLDIQGKLTTAGQTFQITADDGTSLQGTLIAPNDGKLTKDKKGITLPAGAFLVLTLQQDDAPKVSVAVEGADTVVKVGQQTIRRVGDEIVLGQ
ncbi:MAG: hypothetical protein WCJ56_06395 [bacterium]